MDNSSPPSRDSFQDRQESRVAVSSLTMPFLGSRDSDHQAFQYVLDDTSPHGARIVLPNWVVARERLHKDEVINLHVPFRLGKETFDQGRVAWTRWDESQQAQICGMHLCATTLVFYPLFINLDGSRPELDLQNFSVEDGLLAWVLKDTYLLKKGVSIYLEHLIPYFSRVGDYPRKDFQQLKDVFLEDVRAKVQTHKARLRELVMQARDMNLGDDEAAEYLDMEEIRQLTDSELSTDVLGATFTSPLATQQLAAVKTLEKRLYTNYNALAMIYLRSLKAD